MASGGKMMAAALSFIVTSIGMFIYNEICNPIFSQLFPILQVNTPTYWWNFLGGGNVVWMVNMVWFLILAIELIAIIAMVATPFHKVSLEDEI